MRRSLPERPGQGMLHRSAWCDRPHRRHRHAPNRTQTGASNGGAADAPPPRSDPHGVDSNPSEKIAGPSAAQLTLTSVTAACAIVPLPLDTVQATPDGRVWIVTS